MQFIADKQTLKSALDSVAWAVAVKPALPILDGVRFTLIEGILRLTGYGLELAIIAEIAVESQDSGSFIIDAKFLAGFLSKFPNGSIKFLVDDKFLASITSGKSKLSIDARSAEGFPALPETMEAHGVCISQPLLKNMLGQTLYAVSTSDNRPILTRELFNFTDSDSL